jgi:hypothetical protein
MPYIAYLDELGDHSLEIIDREFPLFAAVFFVCDSKTYAHAKALPGLIGCEPR